MKARLAALTAAAALSCFAADTYRVAGVLVDAVSNSPLPHMRVLLTVTGKGQDAASALTGQDGRFAFDLPQGTFNLYALDTAGGASQVYGLRRPGYGPGSSIITGPDQDTAKLVFRWFARAAISGKILDEANEPVRSAEVQLVQWANADGKRVLVTRDWDSTDDRGEYRFGWLAGGTYFVAVTGTPWYARQGAAGPSDALHTAAFAPAYYPGVMDVTQAAPVTVGPGEEARADVRLTSVRGAAVTVKLNGPVDWSGRLDLVSDGLGGSEGNQGAASFSGGAGRHVFNGVPPGRYLVQAQGPSKNGNLVASHRITVGGEDVSVELQPRPAATVSGSVRMQDPGGKLPSQLYVTLISQADSMALSAAVWPDGTFSFPSLLTQKWKPVLRGGGAFATQIQVEGTDLSDGLLDVIEGQSITLSIVATDQAGRVRGYVMHGGKPVSGVLVVIAPEPFGDLSLAHGFQTDSDGSFDFTSVKAGEYLLLATEDDLEYRNPAELRRYTDAAKRIRVDAHATLTENIAQ